MFLGLDLGTSAVKGVLVDDGQRVIAQASSGLSLNLPRPGWSEQDPAAWWRGTEQVLDALKVEAARAVAAVRGIGLSGQMHGATLLDAADQVLRPAILWNDGRSGRQCAELERRVPETPVITGNRAMPGFTAPKLIWVAEHEPEVFARTARVLLPKDYLRLLLTGERVSEMSDAAGTLWLDVGRRDWSGEMLAATRLTRAAMPRLVEGTAVSGALRPDLAARWGMRPGVIVAGGGGDNAAGGAGAGVVAPGDAFVSLGTSGVIFVAADRFTPNPSRGVHTFCHCLPGTWHQMSVILSAASALAWVAEVTGAGDVPSLVAEVEAAGSEAAGDVVFLPYLSGERTPHNDPDARGVFFGLTLATTRASLGRAVLEGVAFALADGLDALSESGPAPAALFVIGGGSRSLYWGQILASVLGRPLLYGAGADIGPAFGAARLARLAVTGEPAATVCVKPRVEQSVEPDSVIVSATARHRETFRRLYPDLRARFADSAARSGPLM